MRGQPKVIYLVSQLWYFEVEGFRKLNLMIFHFVAFVIIGDCRAMLYISYFINLLAVIVKIYLTFM